MRSDYLLDTNIAIGSVDVTSESAKLVEIIRRERKGRKLKTPDATIAF